MGEGAGHLDLHDGDDANAEAKAPSDGHARPEQQGGQLTPDRVVNYLRLKDQNQGQEQDARIAVVVPRQSPVVVLHRREDFLREDAVQTHKQG